MVMDGAPMIRDLPRTMRLRPLLPLLALALVAGATHGCELVLGQLPPARDTDAGPDGSGATSSGATTTGTTSSGVTTTGATTGGSGGGCCDCDGDHHLAMGVCGGDDCDDHDAQVYPGEPTYYGVPIPGSTLGFDYDCSGAAEPDPALNIALNCGSLPPCATGTGFLGKVPPPCGQTAPWGTCTLSDLMCVQDVIDASQLMLCK
jgi:hypothetical protein